MPTDSLLARDLMTRGVVTVPPAMPVSSLGGLLAERGISSAPVTDPEGRLLGIVTEADLIHRLAGKAEPAVGWLRRLLGDADSQAEDYARTHGMEARDIMTVSVITVGPDATAEDCARLLERNGIKRLPVVSEGRLLGIVSRADLLAGVLEAPERIGTPGRSGDARIREALRAEMREQPWAQSLYVFAEVKDGVVTLQGYARSEEIRRALRVLASRVQGVARVEDRLELVSLPLPGEVF